MSILVAVLSSPPLTTGERTRARVDLARELLGFDDVVLVNLIRVATHSTGDLSQVGRDLGVWLEARPAIAEAVAVADAALLGYGCTPPIGPARQHFKAQENWLAGLLDRLGVEVIMVGGQPRHPSRWQRWTSRRYPDIAFSEALRLHFLQTNATSDAAS